MLSWHQKWLHDIQGAAAPSLGDWNIYPLSSSKGITPTMTGTELESLMSGSTQDSGSGMCLIPTPSPAVPYSHPLPTLSHLTHPKMHPLPSPCTHLRLCCPVERRHRHSISIATLIEKGNSEECNWHVVRLKLMHLYLKEKPVFNSIRQYQCQVAANPGANSCTGHPSSSLCPSSDCALGYTSFIWGCYWGFRGWPIWAAPDGHGVPDSAWPGQPFIPRKYALCWLTGNSLQRYNITTIISKKTTPFPTCQLHFCLL